jgi:hypothetical protein
MPPMITHFETDTLPRVVPGQPGSGTLDLLLPFRVEVGGTGVTVRSWVFAVEVNGRRWSPRVRSRRLTAGLAAQLRNRMDRTGDFSFTHLPYYAALDDEAIVAGRAVYLEGTVPQVPGGAEVRYALTVRAGRDHGEDVTTGTPTYRTRVVDPRFTREEVRRTHIPSSGRAPDAYVLLHRRKADLDQIRIDVLDLGFDGPPERADLVVEVDGIEVVDLGAMPRDTGPDGVIEVPLVDVAADSVTVAVPCRDDTLPTITVRHRGVTDEVDLAAPPPVGEARLMFVNFAIQGLNDLFVIPDDGYAPPRSYTQLTMRDEKADYSSRPGAPENGVGDGYAFTIDAHRRFGVPQLWAMNGGLLGLLAHDSPAELAAIAADVDAGRLTPVNAGYGAHRLPYYTKATNRDAIDLGRLALQNMVRYTRGVRRVYYPDSRITVDKPDVTDALRESGVEFLVVDAGADEHGNWDSNTIVQDTKPEIGKHDARRYVDWQYLWRDKRTGAYLLFIDRETKDKLLSATGKEADRGTMPLDLRRKFLEFATLVDERDGNLVVYSDDADKASGNGWFDGSSGSNQRYQAVLSWVAAHPWVRAVTTETLWPAGTDAPKVVGELELVRASDPYIEKRWRLENVAPENGHDNGLAFDTWYGAWARTTAAWLDENLRAISDRAEQALARRTPHDDGSADLVRLARLYFLMCLHESQWSKRPRIDPPSAGATEPEDFVVAESLQLRNTHVYLNASFWAEWATQVPDRGQPEAYRDAGPVIDAVADFEDEGFAGAERPLWSRREVQGLQWDHDPLSNVVLYNAHALVVIDRNGGRITHLFALVGGRAVSISGTHKAYQSLDVDWASFAGAECDGRVLQNTVYTPNHVYVACDVDASRYTTGEPPSPDGVHGWSYPDNFNAYEVAGAASGPAPTAEVALTYGPTRGERLVPTTIAELDEALAADLIAKTSDEPGVVLHDVETFGPFAKTIRLDERTLHVEYRDTRPGHRVANEFCVDLLRAALHGQRQTHAIAASGRSGTVTNEAGLTVRVELHNGCAFTEAPPAPPDPASADAWRFHRVMTDDLEIVAPEGGDFAYRIILP